METSKVAGAVTSTHVGRYAIEWNLMPPRMLYLLEYAVQICK